MKKWLRERFGRHMIRPLVYKFFTRSVLTVFACLAAEFFFHGPNDALTKKNLFLFAALVWLLGAWISHLRLHGLRFPRFDIQRFRRKDPLRNFGDIADHIDDPIVTYADLDDGEKDVCTLLCDLALCPVFAVVSLLV